jgi:hypothetical protein
VVEVVMVFEVELAAQPTPADTFGGWVTALVGADVGLDHTRTIWHPAGPRLVVRREAATREQATADAIAVLAAVGVEAHRHG